MTRQIAFGYGAPSPADLENRIHVLETQVTTLTEAIVLLARALEHGPPAGAADETVARAARHAHEILVESRHAPEPRTSGDR